MPNTSLVHPPNLALQQALVTYDATCRELAALSGTPDLATRTLLGELPISEVQLDWSGLSATMISASPEFQAAQARISRARANLQRQGVQAIPNVTAQLAAGVDNGTNSGLINFQIGAPIPVFNKNQGNIAAARAEYCRQSWTRSESKRNQSRLAVVSREFDSSLAAVSKYSQEILPNAQESLELAEVAYKA